MPQKSVVTGVAFWLAVLILAGSVFVMVATWLGWFRLNMFFEGTSAHHWFSYAGTVFIGLYVPVYSILKRRSPVNVTTLLPIHVFGNLLAFKFIGIHFSHHLTRPPQAFPDLGTGIVLVAALLILVVSGFIMRFRFFQKSYKSWRWLHTATMLTFYLVIMVHILDGLGFF